MPHKRILFLSGTFLLINLIQALFTPISEDEAYYWLWSQNLDWGYFDHPPMVAWWISVGANWVHSELGVRFLTVFFSGLNVFLLWKILQPKTDKQIKLSAIILGSVLIFQVFGFLTTPDAPLLFFTLLYLFSLRLFLERNSVFFTILLAVSLVGLMYSKYHGILVILFTLIPIWKIWIRNPKFYLAVLGSLILYTPHLYWLFEHNFIPIRYHFLERSSDEHFEWRKLFNYLGIYFLGCAPLLSFFIWKSVIKFNSENPFEKSIWWLAVLPGIFFFISTFKDNVQPQWLLISFVAMAMVLYWNYSEKENLKWVFGLGITGVILIFALRILVAVPEVSPLFNNQIFGAWTKKFFIENAVFEKYQEASVYKFYNPGKNVAVHRTLGNRRSQFSLWNWEEDFYGKNVTYISPWVRAEHSFKGYKNRDYYLKEISDYLTYELVEIETAEKISSKPNEKINLKIRIRNGHRHPLTIGKNSELKLNISYYKDLQYEIIYSYGIPTEDFTLRAGEEKVLNIQFRNAPEKGQYKACFGIHYAQTGTAYLSAPLTVLVY